MKASPSASPFRDYHAESIERIRALGLTQSQIDALREFGLLATDNVTGFHEGRNGPGRLNTLLRAITYATQTGRACYYVEMDLRNLGGLNAALGHSGANEVYAAIAGIIRSELSAVGASSVFFRHGGDEMSALLIETTQTGIETAFEEVRRKVAELARKHGVHEVPHPKHPHDRRHRGTGVRFGLVRLLSEHESQPTEVFVLADADVKRRDRAVRPEVA